MWNYLGGDIYELDGKKYSIKKAKEEDLLHTWNCPYCAHSELSYIDKDTAALHFEKCRPAKKALKKQKHP